MNKEETEYIILRKTPYQETSLILAGISSHYGRIDLLVRGAKKIGSKSLPAIDLFREIEININPRKEGLQPIYAAELISNFDNIAMNKNSYLDACEISKFILRNSHPHIPIPIAYKSVKTALSALSNSGETRYSPLVKLALLEEHGVLPKLPLGRKNESELLQKLLTASKGEGELPEISPDYMIEIEKWINTLCRYNELD